MPDRSLEPLHLTPLRIDAKGADYIVHQPRPGDDWPLGYAAVRDGHIWQTNRHLLGDFPSKEAAWEAVEAERHALISRCLEVLSLASYMARIAPELAVAAQVNAGDILHACSPLSDLNLTAVRDLPWVESRSGNSITRGGHDFPWPFIDLIQASAAGWTTGCLQDDPALWPDRATAVKAAQSRFERRIGGLVLTPLAHQLRDALLAAAPHGIEEMSARLASLTDRSHEPAVGSALPGPV